MALAIIGKLEGIRIIAADQMQRGAVGAIRNGQRSTAAILVCLVNSRRSRTEQDVPKIQLVIIGDAADPSTVIEGIVELQRAGSVVPEGDVRRRSGAELDFRQIADRGIAVAGNLAMDYDVAA